MNGTGDVSGRNHPADGLPLPYSAYVAFRLARALIRSYILPRG